MNHIPTLHSTHNSDDSRIGAHFRNSHSEQLSSRILFSKFQLCAAHMLELVEVGLSLTLVTVAVLVVVVIRFKCPVNHTGSPQDSQTQVISKLYTFLNSSHIIYIYIYQPSPLSSQSTKPVIKHTILKHQTQIFEELVPSILPLLKEHITS